MSINLIEVKCACSSLQPSNDNREKKFRYSLKNVCEYDNPRQPERWIRWNKWWCSVQFSRSVVWGSLWPSGPQHASLPCPSPTPGAYSNSCPSNPWCHPTISSSVVPFSSCIQSFPALGSFPMSLFSSGGQSIGSSASSSVLPKNIQSWFPLALTGLISLKSKGLWSLLQHHSSKASILWHSAFFWLPCWLRTHSSVISWRIPGMGEPGGLPSMWSHWVGHDWSDLAAAAAAAGSDAKESTCDVGYLGLIPGLVRSPGEGNGYPLKCSGLENSMRLYSPWDCKESDTTKWLSHSAFFIVQLSHPYITTGKTIALTKWSFVGQVISLLFNRWVGLS